MATNDAFIICDSLVKIFKVADIEVLALQGLDLTVNQGELVGVVGASGIVTVKRGVGQQVLVLIQALSNHLLQRRVRNSPQ